MSIRRRWRDFRMHAWSSWGTATGLIYWRARYAGMPVSLRGLRIGVYQHSSVARDVLVRILQRLGVDVVPLGRAETFVPVDTEALRPEDVAGLLEHPDRTKAGPTAPACGLCLASVEYESSPGDGEHS